jgi:hypothetical protein
MAISRHPPECRHQKGGKWPSDSTIVGLTFQVNGTFLSIPDIYESFGINSGQPMWRPAKARVQVRLADSGGSV